MSARGDQRRVGAALGAAICSALAVALILATGGSAQAANRGLELGIWDTEFLYGDAAARSQWLDRTVDVGAEQVTIQANWREIAPGARPATPSDPGDPAYEWDRLDAAVRDATARGLSVMLMLHQAPDWAEGAGRDPDAPAGSWRPVPELLGQFAGAIGERYSGTTPDPLAPGRTLPRVGLWEIWGEPNLFQHLSPQWERTGGKWDAAAPDHYRSMVNAAYSALKGVDPTNRVIAGGLALAGDYKPGGGRLAPLRFWRDFFCLSGRALKPKKCDGDKPHLDVLGHNPLSVYASVGPFESAQQPDDVFVPDMDKLTRIIRAARKHGRITPRRGTELWATELLAFTNPPTSFGVSEAGQAAYLADALFVLWRQGVSAVTWVGIRDAERASFGTGLFYRGGTAKLSAQAFAFPFVVRPKGKGAARVWGMAPEDGPVQIERQGEDGWTAVETLTARRRVFTGKVRVSRGADLRATAGEAHSLIR